MKTKRDAAIRELRVMFDETAQARGLMAEGQAIPAMRALLRAKHVGKQSIATLLGSCLRAATKQADDASLLRLAELIGFAQQALCRGCRSEVGRKWKEAEDV
jgi:predicted secreted protein